MSQFYTGLGMKGFACVVLLFVSFMFVYGSKQQIHSLPGLAEMPSFKNWAGYITVNETLGKEYYYWFVESQNDPSTDPVLLWMQGGPGCSGLLGFWQENGPFRLLTVSFPYFLVFSFLFAPE